MTTNPFNSTVSVRLDLTEKNSNQIRIHRIHEKNKYSPTVFFKCLGFTKNEYSPTECIEAGGGSSEEKVKFLGKFCRACKKWGFLNFLVVEQLKTVEFLKFFEKPSNIWKKGPRNFFACAWLFFRKSPRSKYEDIGVHNLIRIICKKTSSRAKFLYHYCPTWEVLFTNDPDEIMNTNKFWIYYRFIYLFQK